MSILYDSKQLNAAVKRWANQHRLVNSKKEVPLTVLRELTTKLSKTDIEFNRESIFKILESL
jgi:hypothetical protein